MKKLIFVMMLLVAAIAEAGQNYVVEELDLGPTKGYPKYLAPNRKAELPLVIIYTNGYDNSAPDSTTFECWTYYDSLYIAGSLVYFGTKIGNYESTPTKIKLLWEIVGPTKTIKVQQSKTIPAQRFVAYFLRRSLPSVEGATYAISTKAYSAQPGISGALLHQMINFFYISDVL